MSSATPRGADIYQRWLGISPDDCPPNHYVLLGLKPYESDRGVISKAATERTEMVRRWHLSFPDEYRELSSEIANALNCLEDPEEKAAYDQELRHRERPEQTEIAGETPPPAPVSASALDSPDASPCDAEAENQKEDLANAEHSALPPDMTSSEKPIDSHRANSPRCVVPVAVLPALLLALSGLVAVGFSLWLAVGPLPRGDPPDIGPNELASDALVQTPHFQRVGRQAENATLEVTAAADQTVDQGKPVTLRLAEFTARNPAARCTARINWGDGSRVESGRLTTSLSRSFPSAARVSGTVSGKHLYSRTGTYTVTVTVEVAKRQASSDTLRVTVRNVGPTVVVHNDLRLEEGEETQLVLASYTDPSIGDSHEATIDWGDGTTEEGQVTQTSSTREGSMPGTAGTVSGSHSYPQDGSYQIRVAVTDRAGVSGQAHATVYVDNAPPSIFSSDAQCRGQHVNVKVKFSDPGTTDAHTATIDWGDGSPKSAISVLRLQYSQSAAEPYNLVVGSHKYFDHGRFTIRVTVTDDFGASATQESPVTTPGKAPATPARNAGKWFAVYVQGKPVGVVVKGYNEARAAKRQFERDYSEKVKLVPKDRKYEAEEVLESELEDARHESTLDLPLL